MSVWYWFNKTERGFWAMKTDEPIAQWPEVVGTVEIGFGYNDTTFTDFLTAHKESLVVYTEDNPKLKNYEVEQEDSELTDEQMLEQFGPRPEEFIDYKLYNV